ncbi:MAG: hypothetical protein ABIE70_11100 [bacterium]
MNSTVAFARAFAALKAELARDGAADRRLLRLVEFAKDNAEALLKPAYTGYREEWRSLVQYQLAVDGCLDDLLPDELAAVIEVCKELVDQANLTTIGRELARKLCYVGEAEKALPLLDPDGDDRSSHAAAITPGDTDDELDAARRVLESLPSDSPQAAQLEKILGAWRLEREALSFDSVKCLFVDKGGHTVAAGRGRLRTLVCKSAETAVKLETDEVVFDNQIRSPDDPFVGAAYAALEAVGRLLQRDGAATNNHRLRVHLAIEDSHQAFTGDSIALAVALVGYAMLMKPQIHRHERFIAGEIAVTGSLSADGALMAVNAGSLEAKIKRTFFSPVKYVVVPEDNAATAKECIEKLREQYPRRRLQVIAHDRLSDVIDDHNVIRPEKVCMGAFVARKARRYTGSIRVQVPLLLGLTWLLLALLWPKYFDPWFDWNIADIEVVGNRFRTLNADGQTLWWSEEYEGELSVASYRKTTSTSSRYWQRVDVDGNGRDELFFIPVCGGPRNVAEFYGETGAVQWRRPAYIETTYPGDVAFGDTPARKDYSAIHMITISDSGGNACVAICSDCSPPARDQIIVIDATGKYVSGPYLNVGQLFPAAMKLADFNHDGVNEILAGFTNNQLGRAALAVLDPHHLHGVSPPYDDEFFVASGMGTGSHLVYLSFPETPLSEGPPRNYVSSIKVDTAAGITMVAVVEGIGLQIDGREYSYASDQLLPHITYYLDRYGDPFRAEFADGHLQRLNDFLLKCGKPPIVDTASFLDKLLSSVEVYRRDTDTGGNSVSRRKKTVENNLQDAPLVPTS